MPNNTQSFPGGGSGTGRQDWHPFGIRWGMRNPVSGAHGRGPAGILSSIKANIARTNVFSPPTMVHPDRPIALSGHADPNDHFSPSVMGQGGGPVHPFQAFYEQHLRASGRRSP